jgi:hypothetical protein
VKRLRRESGAQISAPARIGWFAGPGAILALRVSGHGCPPLGAAAGVGRLTRRRGGSQLVSAPKSARGRRGVSTAGARGMRRARSPS